MGRETMGYVGNGAIEYGVCTKELSDLVPLP